MKRWSMRGGAAAMLLLASMAPAARADGPAVFAATYFEVERAATAQGAALVKGYGAAARHEPGNRWVLALEERGRGNRFVAIEAWQDQASFEAHEKAAATAKFRAAYQAIHHSPYDERVTKALAVDAKPVAPKPGAVYVVTHVDVIPPQQAATEALLRQLVDDSRKDAGNLGYDVLQQAAHSNHFELVAAWRSEAAFETHDASAHRRQFRDNLAPMLGAHYDERIYQAIGR